MSAIGETPQLARTSSSFRDFKVSAKLRRLLSGALTVAFVLAGLLFIVFTIGRILPVDPVLAVIGDRAPAGAL